MQGFDTNECSSGCRFEVTLPDRNRREHRGVLEHVYFRLGQLRRTASSLASHAFPQQLLDQVRLAERFQATKTADRLP